MSIIATIAPVVTATPLPTIAAHASTVVVSHANSISDTINALTAKVSATDILVAAGVITTGVQYLLNHFINLRKTINWLISFTLPLVGTVAASAASGQNTLHLAPAIYLLAQVLYFSVEKIKSSVSVTEPVATPAQF